MKTFILPALMLLSAAPSVHAKEVRTNAVVIPNAPDWLKPAQVYQAISRAQNMLEWDIRKITVHWYTNAAEFEKGHGFGSSVLAYSLKQTNTVHMGPKITEENFLAVFTHELVHVILFQKYKDAVPNWLEEGLANHVAKHGRVDYVWLSGQTLPTDVTQMNHPFQGSTGWKTHYMASTALIEMIAAKCDLRDLLQLSVQKKLETYLRTFCEIGDINTDFRKWVSKKAPPKARST